MLTRLEDFADATKATRGDRLPRGTDTVSSCDLIVVRRAKDDTVTLAVEGEIDLESAYVLVRELDRAERSMPRRIVLDLAALGFLDSTGLHLLIEAQRHAEINGHELVLTHVPAHAERLLVLCGIRSRFAFE